MLPPSDQYIQPYNPPNQHQQQVPPGEVYDEYGYDDDFDSDDDESVAGGGRDSSTARRPMGGKQTGGANILSRFTNTSGAALTDYIAGVHLPNDPPSKFIQVAFYDGRPMWAQAEIYNINFGKRQDGSKIGGIKKFQVYSVTPTSTNRSVLRRYKHFDWLLHRLQELFPAVAIPDLPDAKVTGHDDSFIHDREKKLLEWANRMSTHPVISQSEVFQHFSTGNEKDEKKWKNGKRKAEKDPYRGMNSYLAVEGDQTNFSYINSRRVLPALEAYSKYSNEVDRQSRIAMNAAKGLTQTYSGPVKVNFKTFGKSVWTLGGFFKKGLGGNYSDLIYFPDMSALGNAFESIGMAYQKISEMYDNQTDKDFSVVENSLWIQTECIEHIPSMHKLNSAAAETCSNKSNANDEGAIGRLTKVQAATISEINHIQVNTPSHYKSMMKTALEEQINFYKSLIEILEPQLHVLEAAPV